MSYMVCSRGKSSLHSFRLYMRGMLSSFYVMMSLALYFWCATASIDPKPWRAAVAWDQDLMMGHQHYFVTVV